MRIGVLSLVSLAVTISAAPASNGVRNVIMMVSDGFGPASETMARDYIQQLKQLPYNYTTILDSMLIGSSRTASTDSFVTDSAAGAVVFASGIKTYNGAIGVNNDIKPVGTNMEAAHRRGMKTGLVVKSFITDATPAAFASHAAHRDMQDLIADQLAGLVPEIGHNVDLMFGGGRCKFIGNSTKGSCRKDDRDTWGILKKNNWSLLETNDDFKKLSDSPTFPVLGLFDMDKIPYSMDYKTKDVPTLPQMAKKALDILTEATTNSEQGFYVMIEGSRIDHAGHDNDLGTHINEILEYWETIRLVSEYVDAHPDTIMISTSDHETGGLTIGRDNNYYAYPLLYYNQTMSFDVSCKGLLDLPLSKRGQYVTETVLPVHLGISNMTAVSAGNILSATTRQDCLIAMREVLAVKANIFWTTLGHSGVDVNLYAKGKHTEELAGNHENVDIGKFITRTLGLDVNSVTESIKDTNVFQYPYKKVDNTKVYNNFAEYLHR
ncbi:hypothetical protein BB561_003752 [Smittium simulii]|uniref:alkaline phosphatase n=1 Tax=Smittium simulii TaxID=133385 RepID=A0A2T9YJL3_9FUNG|nr:hypothetical protein BB561_003752 [Smittium simulii]